MKPRKMQPTQVPSKDTNRANRFYRDLFDFLQETVDGQRILKVDGHQIQFVESTQTTDIEIIARDHQEDVTKHLKNYFIDFQTEPDFKDDTKIRFLFQDSEGNNISLQVNK